MQTHNIRNHHFFVILYYSDIIGKILNYNIISTDFLHWILATEIIMSNLENVTLATKQLDIVLHKVSRQGRQDDD